MPRGNETLRSDNGFTRRAATKDDLDDITEIHKVSFVEEPEQNYRFPYRDEYPEDYLTWTRKEYHDYLDQPEKYVFQLIEASIESDGKTERIPIALAIWDVAVQIEANVDIGVGQRRDANKKHCEAFAAASAQRPDAFFADLGNKQIYLSILMTHPDWRRRGAGTQLTDWGIDKAKEKEWPLTVCASPMGRLLYEHLGFEKIATEVVQVEGEDEKLETTIMVRKAEKPGTASWWQAASKWWKG